MSYPPNNDADSWGEAWKPLPTWETLVAVEPRLAPLADHVRMIAGGEDWFEYANWKADLTGLVGWDCDTPELKNWQAYTVAHTYLVNLWEGAE